MAATVTSTSLMHLPLVNCVVDGNQTDSSVPTIFEPARGKGGVYVKERPAKIVSVDGEPTSTTKNSGGFA